MSDLNNDQNKNKEKTLEDAKSSEKHEDKKPSIE